MTTTLQSRVKIVMNGVPYKFIASYDGSMTAEAFTPEANCSENVNKMGFKPNQFVYTFSLTIQVPANQDYPIYLRLSTR